MKVFIEKVSHFTAEKRLFSAPCHILLGLSGGADSMALLHTLLNWPQPGIAVSAVHVHHGLRSDEADRDEAFVREQCEALSVPLEVVHIDVGALAQQTGSGVEEAGRQARYAAFNAIADRLGCDCIATAHHGDDQCETVLMHIIRGCGTDGLVGIPAKRGRIIRPLLNCTREDIEVFCSQEQIPYITDSTNKDTTYTRNRVRCEVLPLLRELNPGVDEALRRLADHAAQDSICLSSCAAEALGVPQERGYPLARFSEQPVAVRRRMIFALLHQSSLFTVEEKHILSAEEAILAGRGGVTLPGGHHLTVESGFVRIDLAEKDVSPELPTIFLNEEFPFTFTFGDKTYRLSLLDKEKTMNEQNVHKMFLKYAIDYARIQSGLCIRSRQIGDAMHPSGRHIGKTIKKLMNEWHIPVNCRDNWPLLCDESGVLLVPGYACDQRVCPDEKTKHFLVWEPLSVTG